MSELIDRWHKLKSDIGSFAGDLNSLAIRYEPLADVEEKAYKRGYNKGYQEAMAKTKADMCNGCKHKALAEASCQYTELLKKFNELNSFKQDCILELLGYMKKGTR